MGVSGIWGRKLHEECPALPAGRPAALGRLAWGRGEQCGVGICAEAVPLQTEHGEGAASPNVLLSALKEFH